MEKKPSVFVKVSRKKLYETVADQLASQILSSNLQPGDKLPPERELCGSISVSRTTLREAIKTLEERKLIEVRHGAGVFVRKTSVDMLSEPLYFLLKADTDNYLDVMEVRGILEVEIVGILAERATEEDLERIQQHLERMTELLDDPLEFTKEDLAFHMAIYQAMNNKVISALMVPIMQLLGEFMQVTFEKPGSMESSLQRHEQLMGYIRRRDVEGARGAMREIIYHGKDRLKFRLDSNRERAETQPF